MFKLGAAAFSHTGHHAPPIGRSPTNKDSTSMHGTRMEERDHDQEANGGPGPAKPAIRTHTERQTDRQRRTDSSTDQTHTRTHRQMFRNAKNHKQNASSSSCRGATSKPRQCFPSRSRPHCSPTASSVQWLKGRDGALRTGMHGSGCA